MSPLPVCLQLSEINSQLICRSSHHLIQKPNILFFFLLFLLLLLLLPPLLLLLFFFFLPLLLLPIPLLVGWLISNFCTTFNLLFVALVINVGLDGALPLCQLFRILLGILFGRLFLLLFFFLLLRPSRALYGVS